MVKYVFPIYTTRYTPGIVDWAHWALMTTNPIAHISTLVTLNLVQLMRTHWRRYVDNLRRVWFIGAFHLRAAWTDWGAVYLPLVLFMCPPYLWVNNTLW